MSIDRQVKVNLLLEASQALQSIERLNNLLKEISSVNIGSVNKQLQALGQSTSSLAKPMSDIQKAAAETAASLNKMTSQAAQSQRQQLQSYKQQLIEIKKEAEQIWKNGGDMSGVSLRFHGVTREILDMRKAMGDLSVSLEKTYWEKFIRGLSEGNPILAQGKQRIAELKAEMRELNEIGKLPSAPTVTSTGFTVPNSFSGYKQLLRELQTEAEYFHQKMKNANSEASRRDAENQLIRVERQIETVNAEADSFNKRMSALNKSFFDMDYITSKMKSHLMWIGTGMLLSGAFAIPSSMVENIKNIEQGMAGMRQTMHHSLDTQEKLNKATHEFIGIAAQYGEKIEDIIEAGKLWSRAYKDMGMVQAFMHTSAVLAVADNFSMVEANRALEATMAQLGWQAKNTAEAYAYSMRIADSWTWVAHNAQVSANDLAMANERSAASARMVGVEFDALQGLIAAGVKNTGRSGAEIGNMLKTVFGSIHTDKAIEEIEALGVSMYQVGENGQKEFRKVQDVLLDLAQATRDTDKNIEEVMKAAAGGKFQWSKFAAAMNYRDIIDAMSLSVNSAGEASKQAAMQLDTIARKAEAVKSNLQQAIMSTGDAGLTSIIKGTLDLINRFLEGLQNIPRGAVYAAGAFGAITTAAYVLRSILSSMNTAVVTWNAAQTAMTARAGVASGALMAEAGAANVATASMTRLGIATTVATAGLNILVGMLVTLGASMAGYAMFSDNANAIMEETIEKNNKLIGAKTEEIEITKKQGEFLETLESNYFRLQDALVQYQGNAEKTKAIETDMQATKKALMETIDNEGKTIIENEGITRESFQRVRDAHAQKVSSMTQDLQQMKTAQVQYLEDQAKIIDARIEDYWREANQFNDSIMARIRGLGLLKTAELKYHEWRAGANKQDAAYWTAMADMEENPDVKARFMAEARKSESAAEYHRKAGEDLYAEPLRELQEQKYKIEKELMALKHGGNYSFTPSNVYGGSTVPEKEDKSKDKNAASYGHQPNWDQARERQKWKQQEAELFTKLEQQADKYSATLDTLRTNEELYGQTAENSTKRLEAYKTRKDQLSEDLKEISALKADFEAKLLEKFDSDADWVSKMADLGKTWNEMTKQQRIDAIALHKDYKENREDIEVLLQLIEKLKRKESDISKEGVKVDNDIRQVTIGKSQNKEEIYNNKIRDIESKARNEVDRLNPYSPMYSVQTDMINLKAAEDRLQAIRDRIKEVTAEMEESKRTGNQLSFERASKEFDSLGREASQAKSEIQGLKDKLNSVKQGLADTFLDMAQNGNSFKEVWKKLWNDLAKDALYALLKIKNNSPSILTQVLGLFGSGGKTGTSKPATQHNGGDVTFPKMHSGGDVIGHSIVPNLRSDEVVRTLQVGEEVNSIQQRRSNEILGAVAMKALDVNNSRPNNIVIQAVDSRSFVEYLDNHGAALVSILRKQNALGNR